MKEIAVQMKLEDVSREYAEFTQKFKPKKTTDDCYTPDNIYEVVRDWACKEYGVDPERVVRPFWPGESYDRYPYREGDVVIDNPPFSILSQIVRFYNEYEIPFFLFAPYLTNFATAGMDCTHIITGTNITYQNGADVPTSFLTNLDTEWLVRSASDLTKRIDEENTKNLKATKKTVPKYVYPDEVLTASDVGYMSKHGIEYNVRKADCFHVRYLDSQKAAGKAIFGGGFLLSERAAAERAAAERAAAERAAAERAAAERWKLSEREWQIVRSLGDGADNNQG